MRPARGQPDDRPDPPRRQHRRHPRRRDRIAPHAVRTPLVESPLLNDRLGFRLLVKAECLQHTGSFKLRGATNTVMSLPDSVTDVVAYSSGNHAQAVARAAALRGIRAAIVMPEDAPAMKIEGTKAYGAEVVTYDRYSESREEIGGAIAAERGAELIPPFEDVRVIAGQGTIGLEIAAQCRETGVVPDHVVSCCGGGGLIAGTSLAIRHELPDGTGLGGGTGRLRRHHPLACQRADRTGGPGGAVDLRRGGDAGARRDDLRHQQDDAGRRVRGR